MTTQPVQAISVRGLEKSYKELHVLRGVDFEVARGSMLAAAPAHAAAPAKAATPQLVGTCPETFICAWDPSGYLFWSVNASDNSTYYIDYNVSYVENLTGYNVVVDPQHSGYKYIPPHTGLTYIGDFVYKVSTNG